jgi:hypothetical protein
MRNRLSLPAIVLCFSLIVSSIAGATPVLTLQSDATFIVVADLTPGDLDGRTDYVAFSGTVGAWDIVSVSGNSGPGGLIVAADVRGGNDRPLQIWFSDDDFTNLSDSVTFISSIDGTEPWRESIESSNFWGTDLNSLSNPVSSYSSAFPYFLNNQETIASPLPIVCSMTQVTTLYHWWPDFGNACVFQTTLSNLSTPESSTMILLGIGLLCAALFFRKK